MFQETKWYDETTIELMAPTLLPELHLLKRVKSGSTFCWLCVAVNSVCQTHYLFQPFIHYTVSGEDKGTEILGTVCRPQQRHRASKVWLDCIHLFINNSLNVSLLKPQVFSSHLSINAFLIRGSNVIYWFACACVNWFKVHYLYIYIFLRSILSRDGVLYVKLRAGQLPYKDDPQGWKSLLASTINQRNSGVRAFKVRQCWTSTGENPDKELFKEP